MSVLLLLAALPLLGAACRPVEGDAILARDFAPQVPAFSALEPSTPILDAPFAGVERAVLPEELAKLAGKYRLDLREPSSVCFELAASPLTAEDLIPALKAAYRKEASIEILEFTPTPLPHGKLQFTRGGLEPSGLWHGRLVYGSNRSVNVWAKVRLAEPRTWVEAAELLPAGQPIRADQLVLETGLRSPFEPTVADSVDSVVGKKPVRTFAPGAAIRPQLLMEPPAVERGGKVSVEVAQGGAVLQFDAEAESSGHIGDLVFVRNPENGFRFRAKVEGKGKVAIRK